MSKPFKILQLTNRIPFPLNDGGNIATYYCTKFLKLAGHETHLLSLNTNKHFQDPDVIGDIAEVTAVNINTDLSFFGLSKGLIQKMPYNVKRFYSKEYEEKLIELLKREDFDIVQTEGSYMGIYLKTIREHSNAKIVLRAHNIEFLIWKRLAENSRNLIKKFYLNDLYKKIESFERNVVLEYDGIIAISAIDEQFLLKEMNCENVISIPAGIDFDQFHEKEQKKKEGSVCFLGSLEWEPNKQGLKWFLDYVWDKIRFVNPKASFHIAGKNPPQDLKSDPHRGIVMHGMVENAQEFIRAHEIMVVPLLSGSGMRLKVIEGMALKTCLVSTKVGVEGIDVSEDEIKISDKPEGMALIINDLLLNKNKRAALANNSYRFVKKHYDWTTLIDKFATYYGSL